MVDEKLVQVWEGADPSDAKQSGRWARPNPRDEPPELCVLCQPRPASLGEPLEQARKNETGASDGIALTQHDVGGEVSGGPAVEERGCVSSEFVEEIAQGKALLRVKRKISHIPYGANVIRLVLQFAHWIKPDTGWWTGLSDIGVLVAPADIGADRVVLFSQDE